MKARQPAPATRPRGGARTRRRSRARAWGLAALALVLLGGSALGGLHWLGVVDTAGWTNAGLVETRRRAQELAAALSENLPVYRAQLRTTTCNLPAAGTDDSVQVKLNPGNSTWLNYAHDDFERGASFTYDLGLENVTFLGDISMLQLAKRGSDGWCLRRVQLYVNNDLIFDRRYSASGRWLSNLARDGRTLTISSRQLRLNPAWTAYRPSLPPSRITRSELESRIESAVGDALVGVPVTWSPLGGRAVRLERTGRLTYAGDLALKLRLENWPDPEIDVIFQLAVSCRTGELTMRVRKLQFDVDSPWYSDLATLGIMDRKIEDTLQQAARNVPLTRSTRLLVCPPALEIESNGDLKLY